MDAARAEIEIRGAGPVGCALALALRRASVPVALVDSGPPATAFRPIALSYASRLILERLGVWGRFAVTPIETIVVSQAGSFGRARLEARDSGVPALGYVAEYAALVGALRAEAAGLVRASCAAQAPCIVHAEGTPPEAGGKRYAQDALVGLVQASPSAAATAFERFTAEGPLALLPHAGRFALIWSMRPEHARMMVEAPQKEFLARLAAVAGSAVGEPLSVASLGIQPLSLKVRAARVVGNEVYIGNAAQTLHPVAGQGLNLGLRDAWELARVLKRASGAAIPAALERFASRRRLDAAATIRVTDLLASGFLGSSPWTSAARGAALSALGLFPAPRRFFARRMIFGASALP